MSILRIIVPLLLIGGGLYVIITWVYPHFKATTNRPILYTILLLLGISTINAIFSVENTGLYGWLFGYDLIKTIIKMSMN